MKKVVVHLKNRSYPIWIGRSLLRSSAKRLRSLGAAGSKVLIVSNAKVASHFLKPLRDAFHRSDFEPHHFLLPHGDERDKSARVLAALWSYMSRIPLDRSDAVVALGGGVVGDLAGFAAATYMRGVSLVQVPTTLLAQVDAAVGGKTAIDLPSAKNIVGAFYQPRMVIADIETLKTMDPRELSSQFSEVIKYGVIWDPKLFDLLERRAVSFFDATRRGRIRDRELGFLETVVRRSVQVKAKVVEQDECETKGLRMILNYGHTFAHALEAAGRYRISHGEAVAVGMVLAGNLAVRMGLFSKRDQFRQINLIQSVGLPLAISDLNRQRPGVLKCSGRQLLLFMKRDKKVRNGTLRLVLARRIGKVEIKEVAETTLEKFLEEQRSI